MQPTFQNESWAFFAELINHKLFLIVHAEILACVEVRQPDNVFLPLLLKSDLLLSDMIIKVLFVALC